MNALAARAPRKAKVVELRFFGGLSVEETAEVLRVSPITVMRVARLQLARALALSDDTVKAKSVYDDLFALRENADARIPLINEARAEHARLR